MAGIVIEDGKTSSRGLFEPYRVLDDDVEDLTGEVRLQFMQHFISMGCPAIEHSGQDSGDTEIPVKAILNASEGAEQQR